MKKIGFIFLLVIYLFACEPPNLGVNFRLKPTISTLLFQGKWKLTSVSVISDSSVYVAQLSEYNEIYNIVPVILHFKPDTVTAARSETDVRVTSGRWRFEAEPNLLYLLDKTAFENSFEVTNLTNEVLDLATSKVKLREISLNQLNLTNEQSIISLLAVPLYRIKEPNAIMLGKNETLQLKLHYSKIAN